MFANFCLEFSAIKKWNFRTKSFCANKIFRHLIQLRKMRKLKTSQYKLFSKTNSSKRVNEQKLSFDKTQTVNKDSEQMKRQKNFFLCVVWYGVENLLKFLRPKTWRWDETDGKFSCNEIASSQILFLFQGREFLFLFYLRCKIHLSARLILYRRSTRRVFFTRNLRFLNVSNFFSLLLLGALATVSDEKNSLRK